MNRLKEQFKKSASVNGSYSVGAIVLVLCVVVLVNMLASRLPERVRKVDVSDNKIYEITDTSKKLLKKLDQKVTVTVYAEKSSTDERIRTFLNKYQALSKDVTVKWVDPVLHPAELTKNNVSENSIVVFCKDTGKSDTITFDEILVTDEYAYYTTGSTDATQFDGEGQLTSAINYVTNDSQNKVYYTTGHGESSFSTSVQDQLDKNNVSSEELNLLMTSAANTSLAFVSRNAYGDRCFQFYRDPGADMLLRKDEVIAANIAKSKIFHFGTLSFTSTDTKEATCYAVECAEEAGKLISFDPNIRINLWNDPQEARKAMDYGLKKCDILKISDEELFFLTGIRDQDEAMKILKATYEIPFICLTMGRNGSCAYYHDRKVQMNAFVQEKTVDTTGAGDTFMGCVLNFVLDHGLDGLEEEEIRQMLRFSSAAASIITTRYGALKVMPDQEEIQKYMKDVLTADVKRKLKSI